jgi:hypothetical protein
MKSRSSASRCWLETGHSGTEEAPPQPVWSVAPLWPQAAKRGTSTMEGDSDDRVNG